MEVFNFNAVLNKHIGIWASQIGLPIDQAKIVFCLALAYPLAFLYSFISNRTLKVSTNLFPSKSLLLQCLTTQKKFPIFSLFLFQHIIGMLIGVWFGWFTLGWEILHSFLTSTVVYLIVLLLPRNQSHKVAFVFSLGYLAGR
jgi:hypothetical protein